MKVDRNKMWAGGRIVLAVVLLAAVFKFTISFRDTVTLADGTKVVGTITHQSEREVRVLVNGEDEPRVIPISAVALRNSAPDVSRGPLGLMPDTVRLADGAEVKGKIVEQSDSEVVMLVAGESRAIDASTIAARDDSPDIDQGLYGILRRMRTRAKAMHYAAGLLLLAIVPGVAAVRWRMLLTAQDIHITFRRSMELTLIGLFFNNFMPGLTGGDFIKAYYAAKLTADRKTHAVVTVFLDRIIGMVALGLVAGLALTASLFGVRVSGGLQYQRAAIFVVVFIAASTAGGLIFYSRRLRAACGGAMRVMPGYRKAASIGVVCRAAAVLERIDSALFLYRSKKMVLLMTTLISFVAHCAAIVAIYFFGRSLGITQAGFMQYFVVVPVSFIISSVPLTPAGWGLGEAVFKILFGAVGVPGTAAVTMSIVYRLSQALWTLPGGVILMFEREKGVITHATPEIKQGILSGEDVGAGD